MSESKSTLKVIVVKPECLIINEEIEFDIPIDSNPGIGLDLLRSYIQEVKKCPNYQSWVCACGKSKDRFEIFWKNSGEPNIIGRALTHVYGSTSSDPIIPSECAGDCYIVKSAYTGSTSESTNSRYYVDAEINDFIQCYNSCRKLKILKEPDDIHYRLQEVSTCLIV